MQTQLGSSFPQPDADFDAFWLHALGEFQIEDESVSREKERSSDIPEKALQSSTLNRER